MLKTLAFAMIQIAAVFTGVSSSNTMESKPASAIAQLGGTTGWTGDIAQLGGTTGWTGDIAQIGGTTGWTGDIA